MYLKKSLHIFFHYLYNKYFSVNITQILCLVSYLKKKVSNILLNRKIIKKKKLNNNNNCINNVKSVYTETAYIHKTIL